MRRPPPLLRLLAASFAALGLAACGGSVTGSSDADASAAATSDANASAQCNALENAAQTQLDATENGFLACQADSDCGWTPATMDGWCAAPCGGLISATYQASFVAAAASACQQFNALGCTPPEIGCPAGPPALCVAGSCAAYSFSVTLTVPSSSIATGACAALALNLSPNAAPHDLSFPVTASSGTLYADTTCTTPLTAGTVTVPAGSQTIAFGFEAQAAGSVTISANIPNNSASSSFVVQ